MPFQWRADTLRRDRESVAMRWSDYKERSTPQILSIGVFSSKFPALFMPVARVGAC